MEQSRYMSIVRLGHKTTVDVLNVGDRIVVQEKVDGSNVSIVKDKDKIRAFSRNKELHEGNTLGGFYEFSQLLNVNDLLDGVIYFGEFINPHKIRYQNFEKQFFLFDLYDLETNKYLPFHKVKEEAKRLNLNLIPTFYEGEYQGYEHLQSYIGRTDLGGVLGDVETGEGIIVKNIDYMSRYGRQVFVKLVADVFQEVKVPKPSKNNTLSPEQIFVNSCVTEARVEKFLYKLVDEGILDKEFGIEDMGHILKNMGVLIYEDILREEKDMLPEEFEHKMIRKAIGRKLPSIIKSILNKREVSKVYSNRLEA